MLVTGGTGGIGRAIAHRFAADQAEVFITGRNPDTVARTANAMGASGIVCGATDSTLRRGSTIISYIAGTNFFGGQLSDERYRALVAETHNKWPGAVDDIAQTAYFLASPGARHITGQTIHVNGGAFTAR